MVKTKEAHQKASSSSEEDIPQSNLDTDSLQPHRTITAALVHVSTQIPSFPSTLTQQDPTRSEPLTCVLFFNLFLILVARLL